MAVDGARIRARSDANFDFVKYRFIAFGISLTLILLSVLFFLTRGLNTSIDFNGGVVVDISSKNSGKNLDINAFREVLSADGMRDFSVQEVLSADKKSGLLIKSGISDDEGVEAVSQKIKLAISDFASKYDVDVSIDKFDVVSPQIGSELCTQAAIALVVAIIGIVIYVAVRFEWQYGVGVILALAHDVFLTVGFASALQLAFDISSIAALLTVLGYSVNDSVVIYDRMRAVIKLNPRMPIGDVINLASNATLSRTMLTSGTTLAAILAVAIFGGEVIRSFALMVFFGIAIGTASSIFVSALALLYINNSPEKREKKPRKTAKVI